MTTMGCPRPWSRTCSLTTARPWSTARWEVSGWLGSNTDLVGDMFATRSSPGRIKVRQRRAWPPPRLIAALAKEARAPWPGCDFRAESRQESHRGGVVAQPDQTSKMSCCCGAVDVISPTHAPPAPLVRVVYSGPHKVRCLLQGHRCVQRPVREDGGWRGTLCLSTR